jgi:hypothetical protein
MGLFSASPLEGLMDVDTPGTLEICVYIEMKSIKAHLESTAIFQKVNRE